MNQQGLTRTGNIAVGAYITASDIGFSYSGEDLTRILQTLNSEKTLIILAGINCLIQHSKNFSLTHAAFQEAFCSPFLLNQIYYKNPAGSLIFGRQPTLRLLTEVAYLFDVDSKNDMNQTEVKNELAISYLIVNGLSDEKESGSQNDLETDGENEQAALKRDVLVDFIPLSECRLRPLASRSTSEFLVRTYELLCRLEKTDLNINVNDIFYQATGLTLRNYYHLIALIALKYLNFSLESIVEGESLFIDLKRSPDLKPLYDKLLPDACVSVDTLASEAEKSTSLKNEFRLWRQYPLVRISEDRIICVDITFLLDKLQTGMFWIIRNQLEKEKKGDG